jgi:hypothetical protein
MMAGSGMRRLNQFPPLLARLNRGLFLRVLIVTLLCDQSISKLTASAAAALEYDVKAAFLLNFTKFIDWPPAAFAAADAPLVICVIGDDPFGRAIDQIVEGESVNGHKISVERLRSDQERSCQVLYFGNNRAAATVPGTAGAAVLTVGEGDDFIHQGGIIGFVVDNRRVRFDINLKAATNAGLRLSSKLVSVARSVEK